MARTSPPRAFSPATNPRRVWHVVRVVVAVLFYALWPLQHVYLAVTGNTALYQDFFGASYFPFYPWAWQHLAEPLFPWVVFLVVALEYTLACMMLSRGRTARAGQVGGLIWNLLLAPFPWGWTNLLLAALHAWLATQTFEHGVFGLLKHYRRIQ